MAKPENERERIARIIEPGAWAVFDQCDNDMSHSYLDQKVTIKGAIESSLTRADAIIAQRDSGEPVAVGYRYLYSDQCGGTVWRFETGGREINGCRPIRSKPVYDRPSAPAEVQARVEALVNERVAIAYYHGFVDGVMRQPWEDAADWAAIQGQAYAKTGDRPPFIPVTGPGPDDAPHPPAATISAGELSMRAALLSGSTPKPARVEITEEMVERGAVGIDSVVALGIDNIDRDVARAALTAALSTAPAKDGEA